MLPHYWKSSPAHLFFNFNNRSLYTHYRFKALIYSSFIHIYLLCTCVSALSLYLVSSSQWPQYLLERCRIELATLMWARLTILTSDRLQAMAEFFHFYLRVEVDGVILLGIGQFSVYIMSICSLSDLILLMRIFANVQYGPTPMHL